MITRELFKTVSKKGELFFDDWGFPCFADEKTIAIEILIAMLFCPITICVDLLFSPIEILYLVIYLCVKKYYEGK